MASLVKLQPMTDENMPVHIRMHCRVCGDVLEASMHEKLLFSGGAGIGLGDMIEGMQQHLRDKHGY